MRTSIRCTARAFRLRLKRRIHGDEVLIVFADPRDHLLVPRQDEPQNSGTHDHAFLQSLGEQVVLDAHSLIGIAELSLFGNFVDTFSIMQ